MVRLTTDCRESGRSGELGLTLRELRCMAGLSQRQLGAAAGVSIKKIAAVERGAEVDPSFELVKRLAAAINASLADTERLMRVSGWLKPDETLIPKQSLTTRELLATDADLDEDDRAFMVKVYDRFTKNVVKPSPSRLSAHPGTIDNVSDVAEVESADGQSGGGGDNLRLCALCDVIVTDQDARDLSMIRYHYALCRDHLREAREQRLTRRQLAARVRSRKRDGR